MRITLKLGDITRERADAIVNAANSSLLGGGGVDGAIHRRGGSAILAECRDLRASSYADGLPAGQAVATTAGDLDARWVIHTVGPVYSASDDRSGVLASCYERSLRVADELGATVVAFPDLRMARRGRRASRADHGQPDAEPGGRGPFRPVHRGHARRVQRGTRIAGTGLTRAPAGDGRLLVTQPPAQPEDNGVRPNAPIPFRSEPVRPVPARPAGGQRGGPVVQARLERVPVRAAAVGREGHRRGRGRDQLVPGQPRRGADRGDRPPV